MPQKPLLGLKLPSTRAFMAEADRLEEFSLFDRIHGYIYLHWPYLYIGTGTGEHPLARFLYPLSRLLKPKKADRQPGEIADGYHGKVVPLDAATQLVSVEEDIALENLEHVIPYERARDIVLKNPDHIIALECPCRSSRPDPCLPLDVCLIVGEPFASMVAEHHPQRCRWVSSEEAAAILSAEQARGHVHHAFFKDAMLGRFYAICNCCACCCGAMQMARNGDPMLCSSGYLCVVDEDLCIACGTCEDVCQFDAVSLSYGHSIIDQDTCMGCGVCVAHCTEEALSLRHDPSKGEPLIITELIANTLSAKA